MTQPDHPSGDGEQDRVGAANSRWETRMHVILARRLSATAGEAPPAVHAYGVPDAPPPMPVWRAVCGDELDPQDAEQVPPFTGAPCSVCLLATIGIHSPNETGRNVGTYPALQPVCPTGRWAVALWGERTSHLVAPDAPRAQLEGRDVVHALCGHLGWGPFDTVPNDYPLCPECAQIRAR